MAASSKAKLLTDTSSSANTVPYINAAPAEDSTAATGLGVQVNGTERMRVTATGSVGIGTTAPSERLDLGDGKISMGYERKGTECYSCSTISLSCTSGKKILGCIIAPSTYAAAAQMTTDTTCSGGTIGGSLQYIAMQITCANIR